MRALVKTSNDPPYLELAEAPDPQPRDSQALVQTRAFSLNRGELRRLPRQPDGTVIGWDVAGVVKTAARDGSGPPEGARVVGLVNPGAWAELVAVETNVLAELPDGCSFAQASTLPVAGVTAFQTLALADGLLLDKDVLITGASGGVGRFAIQLAFRAGARRIVGVVGSPERAAGLEQLGAHEVITDFATEGERFDFILESVGGASLTAALNRVAPRGLIVAIGHSSGEPTTFGITDFYRGGVGASLRAFMLFDELRYTQSGARDLRTLAELVARGDLDPQISLEASWNDPWDAIDALMDRRVAGKAVLHVD